MDRFLDWISGDGRYMTRLHCMGGDELWSYTIAFLCVLIIIGYLIIAFHWYKNLATLKPGLAKRSLFNMVNIFLFCGICGYMFPLLSTWWPIYRLQTFFLLFLVYFTWSYALNTPKLKVVYHDLHKADEIVRQLQKEQAVKEELVNIVRKEINIPFERASEELAESIRRSDDPEVKSRLAKILVQLETASRKVQKADDIVNDDILVQR